MRRHRPAEVLSPHSPAAMYGSAQDEYAMEVLRPLATVGTDVLRGEGLRCEGRKSITNQERAPVAKELLRTAVERLYTARFLKLTPVATGRSRCAAAMKS